MLAAGAKVIDFSADYRLDDAATYLEWYGHEHPDAARLGQTVYGLPELFRDRIKGQSLVANPGCYATSAIVPLAPLLKSGLFQTDDIIIDSKSRAWSACAAGLTVHSPEPSILFIERSRMPGARLKNATIATASTPPR